MLVRRRRASVCMCACLHMLLSLLSDGRCFLPRYAHSFTSYLQLLTIRLHLVYTCAKLFDIVFHVRNFRKYRRILN